MAAHRRHGRRGRGDRLGLHEAAARRIEPQAPRRHRGGRADRGRRQRLHRGRALAAQRRRRRDPDRRRRRRARAGRAAQRLARGARRERRGSGARRTHAAAKEDRNIMPASIACAQAGVTTGEWAETLRDGVRRVPRADRRRPRDRRRRRPPRSGARARSRRCRGALGRRIKILVGKPGLDGHSNGAEQIAVRARDCGMEVVYEGIRLTPDADRQRRARGERACRRPLDPVGRPCLAGARRAGRPARRPALPTCRWWSAASSRRPTPSAAQGRGVARVYTPKDFDLTQIMRDIVAVVDAAWKEAA